MSLLQVVSPMVCPFAIRQSFVLFGLDWPHHDFTKDPRSLVYCLFPSPLWNSVHWWCKCRAVRENKLFYTLFVGVCLTFEKLKTAASGAGQWDMLQPFEDSQSNKSFIHPIATARHAFNARCRCSRQKKPFLFQTSCRKHPPHTTWHSPLHRRWWLAFHLKHGTLEEDHYTWELLDKIMDNRIFLVA